MKKVIILVSALVFSTSTLAAHEIGPDAITHKMTTTATQSEAFDASNNLMEKATLQPQVQPEKSVLERHNRTIHDYKQNRNR